MNDSALNVTSLPFHGAAWVVANPVAGGAYGHKRLEEAIRFLQQRIDVADVRWTRKRGDAEQWAREAAAEKVACIFGAGGDGTLNEIANGLAGGDVVFGVLPCGTANVVACELGLPLDPVRAAATLLGGQAERVHLGRAEFQPLSACGPAVPGGEDLAEPSVANPPSPDASAAQPPPAGETQPPRSHEPNSSKAEPARSQPSTRDFLFASGIGFDAFVCRNISLRFKHFARKIAYVIDGLRLFPCYRSPRLHVAIDGGEPTECSELIVCNMRSYGGRLFIAPEASFRTPCLDVCLMRRPGRWNLVRYAFGIALGRHTKYPDVDFRKAQTIEVQSENDAFLHVDGDALGAPPARFTLQREALSLLVPKG